MDNRGNIVSIQFGFLGHNNDSGQLQMMLAMGTGEELYLPASSRIVYSGRDIYVCILYLPHIEISLAICRNNCSTASFQTCALHRMG